MLSGWLPLLIETRIRLFGTADEKASGSSPPRPSSSPNVLNPMNSPPMNSPPMNSPPMNSDPMNSPPMNSPPMNSPPMNSDPMNSPPMNSEPMNSPPMNSDPMNSPTMNSPPMNPPPMTSPPMNSEPMNSDPANWAVQSDFDSTVLAASAAMSRYRNRLRSGDSGPPSGPVNQRRAMASGGGLNLYQAEAPWRQMAPVVFPSPIGAAVVHVGSPGSHSGSSIVSVTFSVMLVWAPHVV